MKIIPIRDFKSFCRFCFAEVTIEEYCSGCNSFVCTKCDNPETMPFHGHTFEQHLVRDRRNVWRNDRRMEGFVFDSVHAMVERRKSGRRLDDLAETVALMREKRAAQQS